MKLSPLRLCCVFVLALGSTAGLQGASITLAPARDATLFSESNNALGAARVLFAGRTNDGDRRRTLLAFDIAGQMPAGATITGASLELRLERSNGSGPSDVPFSLHKVLAGWTEGASGANQSGSLGAGRSPIAGDVTWSSRSVGANPAQVWGLAGGDFQAKASATANVGTTNGDYVWPSTTGLVSDVQQWLNDPATNFGWIVLGDETRSTTARRFSSREATAPAARPALTIEYVPVCEPTSGALAALAAAGLAAARGYSARKNRQS